ncbi:MAG: hypothetical protein LWW79_06445 [Holophagaceae bacterium]|nr:hypothetical protein [Holophagaceae bacterium]
MKKAWFHLQRGSAWLSLLLLVCLWACGGGGGGNSNPGGFTLTSHSASFTAKQGGTPVPASQVISMHVTGTKVAYVGAGTTNGTSLPSWLGVGMTGAGADYAVTITVNSTQMPSGAYTATFQVGTGDANGNILQTQNITVTLTITESLAITSFEIFQSFLYGGISETSSHSVDIHAPNRDWTVSSNAAWLQVPPGTLNGNQTITVTVDASSLTPGTYHATLTATAKLDASDTASLPVTVVVNAPTLTLRGTTLVFGGSDGRGALTAQALAFALGSGSASHAYTVTAQTTSGGNWLKVDPTSGLLNDSDALVQVSVDRTGLRSGTYEGDLQVTVQVKGQTLQATRHVVLNLDANRLVPSTLGVAFTKLPSRSVLTRSIPILSNLGRTNVPWTATSDSAWLAVTPSGVTGGALTLTADPAGLTAETTHFAIVTLGSGDASVENQPTIRVGLHITAHDASTVTLDYPAAHQAASPVEPLLALNDGAASEVRLYNAFDGTLVRTLANVAATPGNMTFSEDGRVLFVHDPTNLGVVAVDPVDGTKLHTFHSSEWVYAVAVFHPAGIPMLIVPGGIAYDLTSNTMVQSQYLNLLGSSLTLKPSPDQTMLVTHWGGAMKVDWTALNGGLLNASWGPSALDVSGREGEACFSANGDRIYTASGGTYDFPATAVATNTLIQRLPGAPYPNAMVSSWNGLVVGGIDGYYALQDIFCYDSPSGIGRGNLSSNSSANAYRSLRHRGLALSADGLRVFSLFVPSSGPAGVYLQDLPSN